MLGEIPQSQSTGRIFRDVPLDRAITVYKQWTKVPSPVSRLMSVSALWLMLAASSVAVAREKPGAAAGDAPSEAPAEASGARFPELVNRVPAVYPAGPLAEGRGAVVPLLLSIDNEGRVVEVQVLEPQGEGFDEAASLAVRQFQFLPARLADGTTAPAQVQYNFVFEATTAPIPRVRGTVVEAGVRQKLAGVELQAVGPEGRRVLAQTDETGAYVFVDLAPGEWIVATNGGPFESISERVTVGADGVVELNLFLVRDARLDALRSDFEVLVVAQRAGVEVAERKLSREEIQYLPGSGGDVVKVVQNLPGVARAPLGIGQLIIRGAAPEDSKAFLDGSPIPLVFHFAGLTTVINNELVEEVAFMPGTPSVRYGRVLAGLVDIRSKATLPERSSGYLSVDVYQSTLFVEQRIGNRSFLTVSGRRSYIDAVLNPILENTGLTVQAPRYYDAQVRWFHKTDSGTVYDTLFFMSDDRFSFVGGEKGEEAVFASFGDRFQRLRFRRLAKLGNGWEEETTVGIGPERRDFVFGDISQASEQRFNVSLREELGIGLTPDRNLGARFGVDLLSGEDSLYFEESRLDEVEEAESFFFAPALYGELTARTGSVTWTPGIRSDLLLYGAGYVGVGWDPRLTARWNIGQNTVVKGATGKFSSLPTLRQVAPDSDGNDQLTFPWSWQNSLGVEQQITGRVRTEVTAFTNFLNDLVVGREDRLRFYTGPPPTGPFDTLPYANDGVGLVCGVEGLLKYTGPTAVGLISATFSHSQRQDRPWEEEELFAYDQPIVLNALWSQQLPRNWRVGGRVRYGSGNPYTPVVNSVFDAATRSYIPVYGERSSDRLPAFTSVDIRFDKTYVFKKWRLETWLDLQNVTFAQNPEVIGWNWNYRELDPVTSNPPLPVFGFKGSW